MFSQMKRALLLCIISFLCGDIFAIHEEFREGYEFISSQASSNQQERPMSFYKDGKVVFFVGDSAYSAVIGNYALQYTFMQGLILQLVSMQLYSELKIAIFTDETKVNDWN